MDDLEVVVAHSARATVRVGGTFLKIDSDPAHHDVEVAAMRLAPVPTPRVLWREPPVLAISSLPGRPLGRLGDPRTAPRASWVAAGAAVRRLHDAPLPPWAGRSLEDVVSALDRECELLVASGTLEPDLVMRNRKGADAALRPWNPVFIHGDLQLDHVFVDGDVVTGVLDWSEAARGDAMWDLATLTIGHPERLADVVEGYGADVDIAAVHAWWSIRSLLHIRWLTEHGFDPFAPGCEVDVLRAGV